MTPRRLQSLLLTWYDRHGRKHLPWQQHRTPYRIWVSEIMLQQTQVATVIPYFERFMAAFPSVQELAVADLDEVLHLWAGLGYYSRARNLHKAARLVAGENGGRLPAHVTDLCRLPGIGRSTAGAIVSLAMDKPAPILDGNVKRLWTRLHGIETWPGDTATEKALWQLSERYLPATRARDYTQALMDFGATLCTRRHPQCGACPFQSDCQGWLSGRVEEIPASRPKRPKSVRQSFCLLIRDPSNRLYLEQRPTTGIWGGLWTFPSWDSRQDLENQCANLGIDPTELHWLAPRHHTFTHFQLEFVPVMVTRPFQSSLIADRPSCWLEAGTEPEIAVPTPVKTLLQELSQSAVVI